MGRGESEGEEGGEWGLRHRQKMRAEDEVRNGKMHRNRERGRAKDTETERERGIR